MPPTIEPLDPAMTTLSPGSVHALINLNICPEYRNTGHRIPIRGGMWPDTIDPFKFFLTKVCEITPIIPPDHVWFGQVFHQMAASLALTGISSLSPAVQDIATVRSQLSGLSGTTEAFIDAVCLRLSKTARKAAAAMTAMASLTVPGGTQTVAEYLEDSRWRNLMIEDKMYVNTFGYPAILNPDRIAFDTRTNKIWIFDYKTTTREPTRRALPCAYEFQAQLNAYVVALHLLDFIRIFDLPTSTTFGGFVHVIVQQPTIIQSSIDRREAQDAAGPGRNPTEQEISDAYDQRVLHWYRKTGPYAASTDPDRILIHASHYNETWTDIINHGLHRRVDALIRLCRTPPNENSSVEGTWYPTGVGYFGDDDFAPAYGKFYGTPISMWSTIMAEEHLHIVRRSQPLLDRWAAPTSDDTRVPGLLSTFKGMTITTGTGQTRYVVPS